eukprot:tig00021254_g19727.t1
MQVARVASRLTRKPKAGAAALHCAGPVASTPSALGEWIRPRTRARLRCTASRAGGLEGGRGSVSPRRAWFFEGGRGPRGRVLAGLRAGAGPFHCGGPGSSRPDAARELRFTEAGLGLRGWTRPARSRAGGLEGGRGSVSLRWAWFFEGGRSSRGRVLAGLRAGAAPFHRGGPGSSRVDAAREVACWRA